MAGPRPKKPRGRKRSVLSKAPKGDAYTLFAPPRCSHLRWFQQVCFDKLTGSAYRVAAVILAANDQKSGAPLTRAVIASALGIDPETARDGIDALVQGGHLSVQRSTDDNRRDVYETIIKAWGPRSAPHRHADEATTTHPERADTPDFASPLEAPEFSGIHDAELEREYFHDCSYLALDIPENDRVFSSIYESGPAPGGNGPYPPSRPDGLPPQGEARQGPPPLDGAVDTPSAEPPTLDDRARTRPLPGAAAPPPAGTEHAEVSNDGFDAFLAVYPGGLSWWGAIEREKAREDARAAFEAAIVKGAAPEEITAGAAAFRRVAEKLAADRNEGEDPGEIVQEPAAWIARGKWRSFPSR